MILEGRNRVVTREQVVTASPGDVLVYRAGLTHEERCAGEAGLVVLYVRFEATDDFLRELDLPLRSPDGAGRIHSLVEWMMELHPAARPHDQAALDALLLAALHEHARPTEASEGELLRRVKQYAHEHLTEPIALDDLAAAAHLSKFHFARRFRQATGLPPMRFVRRMRVEAVKSLLTTSELPLKTIAAITGFADAFQLSKTFRAVTGRSPRRWRG
jgi:AraC-like DNA-binding protein